MVAHLALEPGDTVVFNNHRALHGRDTFKVANDVSTSAITFVRGFCRVNGFIVSLRILSALLLRRMYCRRWRDGERRQDIDVENILRIIRSIDILLLSSIQLPACANYFSLSEIL